MARCATTLYSIHTCIHTDSQQEFSISYEYEGKAPDVKKPKQEPKSDPEPEAHNYNKKGNFTSTVARKLMQSEDFGHSDVMLRMEYNSSTHKEPDGIVDRRSLIGFKSSFSVTYKTETTDTTANTFSTKDSDFTTSTFLVNCQCPVGANDRYCKFENSYSSQVSWTSSRWTGGSSSVNRLHVSKMCDIMISNAEVLPPPTITSHHTRWICHQYATAV